jgi:hypothetical protein
MRYFKAAIRLFPALLLALTLTACDSGGGNGGGNSLGNSVTLEVEGDSEATVSWSSQFWYDQDDGFCGSSGGLELSASVPVEKSIDLPSSLSGCSDDTSPEDFTGVQVAVTTTDSPDLTVRLVSDGNTIAELEEPNGEGAQAGSYVLEGGDVPDLSDLPGN